MLKKLEGGITAILARVHEHHLFSFAAAGAFFLLLSFIPFILILLVLIRYTTLSETDMMNMLIRIVPTELGTFVSAIVKEVYTKSIAVLPVSILVALWSSAKALHALSYGLDVVNNVTEKRNWFVMRFRSMFYTLVLAVSVLGALLLLVFSKGIQTQAKEHFSYFLNFIITNRYIVSCILLTMLFVFMYKLLPNRKMDTIAQIPGALMVGIAWTAFSWFLSIFYSPGVMNTYGSFTAVVIAMIWMYFCMYFFLVGAEINYILSGTPENNIILAMVRDACFAYYQGKEQKALAQEAGVHYIRPAAEADERGMNYRMVKSLKRLRRRKAQG